MRERVERRQPHKPTSQGSITLGDVSHEVIIRQIDSHGFSIVSNIWVKEGEILSLQVPGVDVTEDYPCAVVYCRRCNRLDDSGSNYYLLLEKLSEPCLVVPRGPLSV